jgi:hypothetical protein
MMKRILAVCGLGLVTVLTAQAVNAQDVATLVLRDGQRPSGQQLDLNAGGYTLRVNDRDVTFPANEVAAVEFSGGAPTPEVRARIDAGESLIVLRTGQIIGGRLVDIGGTHPLRITVDTPNGQRDFMSNDIAQIYLYAPMQATAPAVASARAGAIVLQGNQPWTSSGISVRKGERIAFSATGDIMIAANASSGIGGSPAVTSPTIRYPVVNSPVGALIARIGNGVPLAIGANTQPITMPATGQLFLGINDDHFEDNSGTYTVTLTRLGR